LIVRFKVTTLSHPAAFVSVKVGVSVLEVYRIPCQLNVSHAVTVSTPVLLWLMVRFKVTTLSHPAAFVSVKVGVSVLAV
jgi:hypothetical protein